MSDTPEETAKKRRLLEELHAIEAELNTQNGKNGSVDDVKMVVQTEVDLETQMDIIEIGANAIYVELQNISKLTDEIYRKVDSLEKRFNGTSE